MDFNMRKLAFACLMLIVAVYAKTGKDCNCKGSDVVFILDSSASVWYKDFDRQLEFVNEVVDELNIGNGHNQTQVGVLTYGDQVQIEFYLHQYKDKRKMKREISRIRHVAGRSTQTGEAIRVARDVMLRTGCTARTDVDRIAIVITDGRSTNGKATLKEADLARATGIRLYAIGIGNNIHMEELKGITSSPESIFTLESYRALSALKSILVAEICKVTCIP